MIVGPKASASENETFGRILLSFRERTRLTRRQVAAQLGFTSEYLRLIERGERTPALGNIPEFAELYGVPYSISGNRVVLGDYTVDFTSRIRQARGQGPKLRSVSDRTKRLGQIVQILDLVDDETLEQVYSLLKRKRNQN